MADPETNTHALLSPSGADGWMNCAGWSSSNTSSPYAREGTAAHELGEMCLTNGTDAVAYLGRVIKVEGDPFVVDEEMAGHVQVYVDLVREVVASTGGELLVEQRLPIAHITGEIGAEGTSDTVILTPDEIIVIDLKYGRGVQVDATENKQMQLYALGGLRKFEMLGDFKRVRMMISQPRVSVKPSEWDCTVEQLLAFGELASEKALQAMPSELVPPTLSPSEKACKWCANKATCKARTELVVQTVTGATLDEFMDLDSTTQAEDIKVGISLITATAAIPDDGAFLATFLPHLDLIEDWVAAVRAKANELLRAGVPVPGYKLVQGKQGNRAWSDATQAEALLKTMRLKQEQMYDFKVISPTSAEKLVKAEVIGPRQWPKLQALITRAEGGLSVAPVSDKRPAVEVKPVADEFSDLTETPVPQEAHDLV